MALRASLLLLFAVHTQASSYDLVIYGATPSGIAAALSFVNASSGSVALIEPTGGVGGMSGSGGIGFRDYMTPEPCCTMVDWGNINALHYNVSYPVWQPDNYVGHASFLTLLHSAGVSLFLSEPYEANSVVLTNSRIVSITTKTQTWTATNFIDASYEGEIMKETTSFTWGREPAAEYNESLGGVLKHTPPFNTPVSGVYQNGSTVRYVEPAITELPLGSGDKGVMGFSYRPCVTNNKANKVPFPKPENYDEEDFELMRRYVAAQSSAPSLGSLFGILGYRSFPLKNKWDLCDRGSVPVTSDVVDSTIEKYMNGTLQDRADVAKAVRYYVQGFLFFLSNSTMVPKETRDSVNTYGLCADEWPENGHFPPQLYVREGLRMIGDKVFAQPDWQNGTSSRSIGKGGWGIDIHIVHRRVDAQGFVYDEGFESYSTGSHPYDLPLDLVLPKRASVQNLLVTSTPSLTHVTWACIREEPTLWLLGMAAGTTAALTEAGVAVQDVSISALQKLLKGQGVQGI